MNMEATIRTSATMRTLSALEQWLQSESRTAGEILGGESITRIQVIRLHLVFLFISLAAITADLLPVCGIFTVLAAMTCRKFVANTPEGKKGGAA